MDDMKGKFKGWMKNLHNSSPASSSGKFKGQGRVLGSSSTGPSDPIIVCQSQPPPPQSKPISSTNSSQIPQSKPISGSNSSSPPSQTTQSKPSSSSDSLSSAMGSISLVQKVENSSDPCKPEFSNEVNWDRIPAEGFDPFDSLITSGKRCRNGLSVEVFECPICKEPFRSEDEVSEHVDNCVNKSAENKSNELGNLHSELDSCISGFLSEKPSTGSLDVVLKLLGNIVREPENAKFRKIRMSNPKVREAIGEVAGGVDLLEVVGFTLRDEEGEIWATMEVPSKEQISLIKMAINKLEPSKVQEPPKVQEPQKTATSVEVGQKVEPKKIDREIKVFFSVPENMAAKIVLPDSFYNLTPQEIKREAETRKKNLEDSQLLIPKSYREKQAKAAKNRYRKTLIRIQFPDGVVLQGVFNPWEPTSSLYEFVSSALKEPCLKFELLDPVLVKRRVVPSFSARGQKPTTLADENLVPSALIKFRPIETDSVVFTGLSNEYLQISEPLV